MFRGFRHTSHVILLGGYYLLGGDFGACLTQVFRRTGPGLTPSEAASIGTLVAYTKWLSSRRPGRSQLGPG